MAASRMQVIETFHNYSEQAMVIQENASKWLWKGDISLLECNMLVSVGSEAQLESMVKDQIKNATCHARKTAQGLVVQDGETVFSN